MVVIITDQLSGKNNNTHLLKITEKYSTHAHVDKNSIYFEFNPFFFKNVTRKSNF